MDIQKIKELALANGFKLKEQASGNMDLNAYVYDFANAIEQEAKANAVPEGFVLMPKTPDVNIVKKICTEFILGEDLNGNPVGLEPCDAEDVLEIIVKALEPAND